ncbi:hypothetical protein GCM10010124_10620 [Pilimelia terevasa]|uniref:DUF5941 domain-containing protein n=1 Tax=Pilimelia terevasa TaxID=53372 RepID=A0A8J3FIN3_9ACTN|nr:hypothetical protein GCM10010124_10620 [Pilimelia terevasa]
MARALVVGDVRDGELAAKLRAAGATGVDRVPAAALPRALHETVGPDGVLVVAGDLIAHGTVLRHLLTVPGGGSVALTGTADDLGAPVSVARGQVTGCGGPPVPPAAPATFLGALRLSPETVAAVPRAAGRGEGPGAVDALLADLHAAGARIGTQPVRLLVAGRAAGDADAAALRHRLDAVDEDAAALRLAVKEQDDFFTTFAISTWSPHVTRLAARLGLTPSMVTALSVVLAVVAAAGFVRGTRAGLVTGGVLLYLSFVLDCVDGQVARYTRRFGAFGGWLDTMADRTKEYLAYAGLAWGAERAGIEGVWPLAVAAMVLQTVRHQTDFWYGALHDEAARRPAADVGGALGRMSVRVQSGGRSAAYWLKRIVVFPIGERWALMAVVAALGDGRAALLAVLACGAFAAAYTLTLRTLRARVMRVPVLAGADLPAVRDEQGRERAPARSRLRPLPLTGLALLAALAALAVAVGTLPGGRPGAVLLVLAAAGLAVLPRARPHDGALDWLVPAALRGTEYVALVALGAAFAVPWPWIFGATAVLALRHYDQQTRLEKGAPAARRLAWDVSWELRLAAVLVLVWFAPVAAFAAAALYVGVLLALQVRRSWVTG